MNVAVLEKRDRETRTQTGETGEHVVEANRESVHGTFIKQGGGCSWFSGSSRNLTGPSLMILPPKNTWNRHHESSHSSVSLQNQSSLGAGFADPDAGFPEHNECVSGTMAVKKREKSTIQVDASSGSGHLGEERISSVQQTNLSGPCEGPVRLWSLEQSI